MGTGRDRQPRKGQGRFAHILGERVLGRWYLEESYLLGSPGAFQALEPLTFG